MASFSRRDYLALFELASSSWWYSESTIVKSNMEKIMDLVESMIGQMPDRPIASRKKSKSK